MGGPFAIGDRVWYVLPMGPGCPRPIYAAAVVVRFGKTRVGVRSVLGSRLRYVLPFSLTANEPPDDGTVDILWSAQDASAPRQAWWLGARPR